jgi:hypothetical protein
MPVSYHKGDYTMTTGTLFLIIAFAGFFIFATQAGAKESKFLSSPLSSILFLLIVGLVLWFLWSGAHVALVK